MLHFHTRSVHEYVNNMVIIEIQYSSQQSISTSNISVYNMISKFVIIKCPHDNLTNLTFFFWTVTFLDVVLPRGVAMRVTQSFSRWRATGADTLKSKSHVRSDM